MKTIELAWSWEFLVGSSEFLVDINPIVVTLNSFQGLFCRKDAEINSLLSGENIFAYKKRVAIKATLCAVIFELPHLNTTWAKIH
ncbi:hypothetical protein, partial [Pedobacter terrae]|uniref:hypothetical protein n=1 Tax=Pedobacter terrae TaxID=405671 RepID=UPI001ABF4F49